MRTSRIISLAVALLVLAALPVQSFAAGWDIDPVHTEVGFKVRHMMVTNVRGKFHDVKGTVQINDSDITLSTVKVAIQTASIDTGIEKRDTHLRSADFFDVEKYPEMTFISKKFAKIADGVFKVTGDLSMHGITREIVLNVEGLDHEAKDPWGNIKMGAFASPKVNRKDFGLTWNKVLETGGVMVGDEISIILEIELTKQVK